MKGNFNGKVAIVTGGSSGIGRAAVLAFAREMAKVIVADIDLEGGKKTVQMVEQEGGSATLIKTDVSKAADVQAMVDVAVETYGRLDYAFNNAGIDSPRVPLAERTEEDWDRSIGVNLKGMWLCMKYEIPRMIRCGGGAIVNTSSIAGLVGFPNNAAYVAGKHGVIGLTKSAALDYAKYGVRVNAVCPGATQTPLLGRQISGGTPFALSPIERIAAPDEIAQAVVWLCSDAASFVTGVALPVDGGFVAR